MAPIPRGVRSLVARYYDPATGRFISRDPVWDPNNVGNPYTFCGYSPISGRDPMGEDFGIFSGALIVMGASALIHLAQEAIVQHYTATETDYAGYGRAAGGGAVIGAASLIPGVAAARYAGAGWGGVAALYGADAVSGVIAQGGEDWRRGEGLSSPGQYALAAALGPALRGAFSGGGRLLEGVCFLAGTQVETDHGRVTIEDIQVGDRVLSRDPSTGDQAYKPVTRLFRGQTEEVAYVRLVGRPATRGRTEHHRVGVATSGDEGDGQDSDPDSSQTLRCTPEHPFWVVGRGWVSAVELRGGDHLLGSKGEELVVGGVDVRKENANRYNFEVGEYHTYFVAGELDAPAVWVHNACQFGDATYAGRVPLGRRAWRLTSEGDGAHLVERVSVRSRSGPGNHQMREIFDAADTPRFYPSSLNLSGERAIRNAGMAHRRLHRATRKAGLRLREGGTDHLSPRQLMDKYEQAYSDDALSGILGDLRTPDGATVLGTNLTPGEAFGLLRQWSRQRYQDLSGF